MAPGRILIGTGKGLIEVVNEGYVSEGHASAGHANWRIRQVHFNGLPVSMVYHDERVGRTWAGISHRHWGQKLEYSDDLVEWHPVSTPVFPQGLTLPSGKPATLRKIWSMHHAGSDRPGDYWLGVEPGALFYGTGGGKEFSLVEGLWNHPSRQRENQWFGAGRDLSFIHSIIVDPRDSGHVYVAVSCAGVFETRDGGKSWRPRNQGLIAAYLPNPEAEVGHDPHMMLACAADPDVIWQQNHCGIFRTSDGGADWENVTDRNGLADYGFALAIDHEDPLKAWVIPAVSDEERVAVDHALCVCTTDDGGKTWRPLREGLPQEFCFDIVFRHAFARMGATMAFGTSTGNFYISDDNGMHWRALSNNLARVEAVAMVAKGT